jgi:hypothetical protein
MPDSAMKVECGNPDRISTPPHPKMPVLLIIYGISSRSLFALANGWQFYTLEGNGACLGAAGP